MSTKRCVVLFSGNGSNLENLLNKRDETKDKLNYVSAFTDNAEAKGIDVCKKFDLNVSVSKKDTLKEVFQLPKRTFTMLLKILIKDCSQNHFVK